MLSPESKKVLDAIRQLTGEDDIFKVVEADEILEKLPREDEMTKIQLSAVIRDLRDRDFLKVKYFTPDEYCLLTEKRAEEIHQLVEEVHAAATGENSIKESVSGKADKKQIPLRSRKAFLFSFLGAVLGGGIVTAIAIVLQKFLV